MQNKKRAEAFPDLSKTKAVDNEGRPLLLFRGENGVHSGNHLSLQSKLGSYSFGDARIANHYAGVDADGEYTDERDYSDFHIKAHRVYPVYLNITNPVVNWADPFIEYPDMVKSVGEELTLQLLIKHQDYVFNTDNWHSNIDPGKVYGDVATVAEKAPHLLSEIYLDIWPILDDPIFVNEARKRGFDGAIYNGTGENMSTLEYRIFDAGQAIFALTGERAEPEGPELPTKKRKMVRARELDDTLAMGM